MLTKKVITLLKGKSNQIIYKYGTDNIGVCKYCEEKFNTHQISDEDFELCRQYGLCPTCARKYMKFKEMDKAVIIQKFLFEKEKKAPLEVLRAGYKLAFWGLYRRILFKGGHRVGERFRRVFVDAVINNPAFTINMFNDFTDCSYCSKVLKFGSYPMIIDVTNVSDSEQRFLKEDLYGCYGVTRYRVFDRTIRLINQIYEKNLVACIAEFKRLGLIPQDAEY